jgi:hypothetical protein
MEHGTGEALLGLIGRWTRNAFLWTGWLGNGSETKKWNMALGRLCLITLLVRYYVVIVDEIY